MNVGEHCVEIQIAFAIDLPCITDNAAQIVNLFVIDGLRKHETGTGITLTNGVATANISSAESLKVIKRYL